MVGKREELDDLFCTGLGIVTGSRIGAVDERFGTGGLRGIGDLGCSSRTMDFLLRMLRMLGILKVDLVGDGPRGSYESKIDSESESRESPADLNLKGRGGVGARRVVLESLNGFRTEPASYDVPKVTWLSPGFSPSPNNDCSVSAVPGRASSSNLHCLFSASSLSLSD
jgi:hypothetical protein